jgi:hypothetical protein
MKKCNDLRGRGIAFRVLEDDELKIVRSWVDDCLDAGATNLRHERSQTCPNCFVSDCEGCLTRIIIVPINMNHVSGRGSPLICLLDSFDVQNVSWESYAPSAGQIMHRKRPHLFPAIDPRHSHVQGNVRLILRDEVQESSLHSHPPYVLSVIGGSEY